jgi:jasmonate ZIM domain-containing protein
MASFLCVAVEAEAKTTLPGAEEAGRKETMELFPQSAGLGAVQDAAAPDATRYRATLL